METRKRFTVTNKRSDEQLKSFFRDNERFADLFNSCLFRGEKRVDPKGLREVDSEFALSIFSKDFQKEITKTRDVVKLDRDGSYYRILGLENQDKIHYAMPLRCMVYDVLSYLRWVEDVSRKNRREKTYGNIDEFLSGWTKKDRLVPCYTIVIYWGSKPWDGPRALSDMMEFDPDGERPSKFQDYRPLLFSVNEIAEFDFDNREVGQLFQIVKALNTNGGRDMPEIMRNVDVDVAYTAALVTHVTGRYSQLIDKAIQEGKESVDMCEALEKVLLEERAEGRLEGQLEGREEMAFRLLKEGVDMNVIQKASKLSDETIKKIAEKAGII